MSEMKGVCSSQFATPSTIGTQTLGGAHTEVLVKIIYYCDVHPTNNLELTSKRRVAVKWRQGWPPNYIQRPASRPLVVMKRLGTQEASSHYPAIGARLEAKPVVLESAEWWFRVDCWRPKPVKKKIGRLRGGQPMVAHWQPSSWPP